MPHSQPQPPEDKDAVLDQPLLLNLDDDNDHHLCNDNDPLRVSSQHRRDMTLTNIAQVYKLVEEEVANDKNDDKSVDDLISGGRPIPEPSSLNIDISSMAGSVANLCSATLGAGVLALPYAIMQAGYIVGFILLIIAAISTYISIRILVLATDYYHLPTYELLSEHVISKTCRNIVEASMLIFCGGCAVAYMIAVGDILEQAHLLLLGSRKYSMCLAWIIFMLPLSLFRKVQNLQFASATGIAAIGTLVFAAAIHWMTSSGTDDDDYNDDDDNNVDGEATTKTKLSDFLWPAHGVVSVLTACPVVLFAFSCQVNVCAIYDELPDVVDNNTTDRNNNNENNNSNKQNRMKQVTLVAVGICTLLYSSVSFVALADFGHDMMPNMLSCYRDGGGGPVMQVATAAMALAVVLAFPLNIFPARVTLLGLIEKQQQEVVVEQQQQQVSSPRPSLDTTTTTGAATRREEEDGNADDEEENLAEALLPGSARALSLGSGDEDLVDKEQGVGARGADGPRAHTRMEPLQMYESVRPVTAPGGATAVADDDRFNLRLHIVTTLFLTGMALALALVLPNISVVFGLLGGTASSMLGFCVPGLLGIQMSRDLQAETGHRQLALATSSYLLVAGGVLVGILTTLVTIYDMFTGGK